MFEKIGQSAEKVVSKVSVSRRGFLGTAAKLAAGVGAAMAGLTASRAEAYAHQCWCARQGGQPYCVYSNGETRSAPTCKCPIVKGAKVVSIGCYNPWP
jgi:hypothetical protein